MQAVVAEPNTQGYTNYVNAFFGDLPVDATKYRTEVIKILPGTAFTKNTRNFTFIFNKLEFPYAYELHQTVVSVKVRIVKKDGSLPNDGATVCGINSMVSSLFSNVTLKINDQLISVNSDNHFLSSYMQTVLTYSNEVKNHGWLSSSGFFMDTKIIPGVPNAGLIERAEFFHKQRDMHQPFSEEGAHMVIFCFHIF